MSEMTISTIQAPVGPSNTTFTDHVTSDSKLPTYPTYPQYGGHIQTQPEQQAIQPQMTGIGSAYPLMQPQGFALQQTQQAPTNLAAPVQQFYSSVPLANLGEASAPADCPMCRNRAMTLTNHEVGNTTHMCAVGFCLFTGLGFIPYLMTSTKDVKHNCGRCGARLATWYRNGRTIVHAYC